MINPMDSEFKALLDTLRHLGIPFYINWLPTTEGWQKTIDRAGYQITALACIVVVIGKEEYLFSTGQIEWDKNGNGYGLRGLFMLSRNSETGVVTNRVYQCDDGVKENLAAIKRQYRREQWAHE